MLLYYKRKNLPIYFRIITAFSFGKDDRDMIILNMNKKGMEC